MRAMELKGRRYTSSDGQASQLIQVPLIRKWKSSVIRHLGRVGSLALSRQTRSQNMGGVIDDL